MAHRNARRRVPHPVAVRCEQARDPRSQVFSDQPVLVWKMATSFVFTAEPWLGADGEDALHIVGVSRHERLAVVQRIKHDEDLSFSQPTWLARHQVEDRYVATLPRRQTEITPEEAAMLARVFGKNGELPAQRLS